MSSEILFERIAIIGLGLMGASLALALRRRHCVREIVGVSRTAATAARALEMGVVDRIAESPRTGVAGADAVVIATPVCTVPEVLTDAAGALEDDAVVTDVGSVKGFVVEQARRVLGHGSMANFVPGHPIAGTERSGVGAAFPELYDHRHVVLTPVEETGDRPLSRVTHMWETAGADVIEMPVEQHDRLLAATSHLPHVIAYALVECLADDPDAERLFDLAAGGFYDFTRIASSDPTMWRDICLTNKHAILDAVGVFRDRIDAFERAIGSADGERLLRRFANAKRARDGGLSKKKRP